MMTFVPKQIYYCIFCFYLVSLFVVTATISHQATHIEERVEEQYVERHNTNSDYDKSKCLPRTHTYDNTVLTPAPDLFRVQWTLTTTTTTEPATTTKISTLTMEFNRTWSPIGVDRMYQLIIDHYFDCAVFFRVVPGFIIQFGIASEPEETKKWDVSISDDPMYVQPNIRGTISFATAGPTTRTTQLFMNTQDNHEYLDRMGFTPIGIIVMNTDSDDETDAMDTVVPYIAKPKTKADEDGIDQGQYMKYGNHWIYQHYPEVDLIINTTLITTTSTTNDNNNESDNVEVVVDHEIESSSSSSVDSIPIIGRISSPQDDQQTHRFQNRQYNDNDEKNNDGNR